MTHFTFVGTSHIAKESVQALEKLFKENPPDIVAVELDPMRAHALFTNAKPSRSPALIKEVGFAGYLFALVGGLLQQHLGKLVGMQPGSDMKTALILAKKHEKKAYLIDQPVTKTLKGFKKIPFKEKMRLVTDNFTQPRKKLKIDLSKVPAETLIHDMLTQFKKRYPTLHKVLIQDRNDHMTQALLHIAKEHPEAHVAVVLGAGHKKDVLNQITNYIRRAKQ